MTGIAAMTGAVLPCRVAALTRFRFAHNFRAKVPVLGRFV